MKPIQKIIVLINFRDQEIEVGELIQDKKSIYFRYYTDFIKSGLEISPFHLPIGDAIYTAPSSPYEGLFGVFSDSLPDGWGRLLLDRALSSNGILIQDITPLQRLSYVGSKGMGALVYRPATQHSFHDELRVELDTISVEMNIVFKGTSSQLIDELYELGGSSGGARPKILVGYNEATGNLLHGIVPLPDGYEDWLIKFPSSNDSFDIAQIEYAYHKMALDAGINMNPCKLFESQSGKIFFGTKRFDRTNKDRLHMHSAAGLLKDNFRLSTMDYGHLMEATFKLEQDVAGHEKILRIAAFNVFANNRDDHSKNISYLMDSQGKWQLAPAYDLTFSNSSHGYHSTMIAGESANPTKKDLMNLAQHFSVKKATEIILQVQEAANNWMNYARDAGVENESAVLIQNKIQAALIK